MTPPAIPTNPILDVQGWAIRARPLRETQNWVVSGLVATLPSGVWRKTRGAV